MSSRVHALSIAGSDASGGAGIQADLKTFGALGAYGMSAITALTAQNTQGVQGVHPVPPAFVADQINAVFEDIRVDAVKIGMLGSAPVIEAVVACLARWQPPWVVLDPVMVAKSGDRLLDEDAVATLRDALLPRAHVITPNLPEAAVLLDEATATDVAGMHGAGERLRALGVSAALVKGGHMSGADPTDVLVDAAGAHELKGRRVATKNTHGTGCTLSSALAALAPRAATLAEAARGAKAYLGAALAAADELAVGHGHGPVDHLVAFQPGLQDGDPEAGAGRGKA